MPKAYSTFGGYILFKEMLDDELGHLYRAAEITKDGVKRTVFLRTFDAPNVPKADLVGQLDDANKVGKILQAANVVSKPVCFVKDGVPAVAFDFVAAQPLSRVLEKVHEEGFPVPVDNALLILEKLALALSAALTVESGGHALVHGFLHPAMMLVSNDGEGLVAGFGLADQLLGLVDQAEIADSVHPYLAPEVLVTRNASKRADVYSLGAILYQLLTGQRVPTRPEERAGILDSAELAYDERPIPDDIKTLLHKALATRPEERFSSAADFKKELDKLLYGGAYSPTTFNLALFMDRLFRAEVEAEEKEREVEAKIDWAEYLAPEPEPEPEPVAVSATAAAAGGGGNKGLLIGGLVVAVAIIVGLVVVIGRGGGGGDIPPTPSPEQVAAERAANEQRLRELAAQMVEERMKEREEQLRQEMEDKQQKINELQKQLKATEKGTALSAEDQKKRDELQRQIAAEQEAKRQMEAAAEAERQKALQQARQEAAAQQAATATAVAAVKVTESRPTVPPPTQAPAQATAAPTSVAALPTAAAAQPTAAAGPAGPVTITENMFLHPSDVDTLPVMIKEEKVEWSRAASRSNKKGMVIVQATVDADGKVESVSVLRADESGFDIPQSVIESVKKYRFKPATKNGIKVKSYATVTCRFNFRSSR